MVFWRIFDMQWAHKFAAGVTFPTCERKSDSTLRSEMIVFFMAGHRKKWNQEQQRLAGNNGKILHFKNDNEWANSIKALLCH